KQPGDDVTRRDAVILLAHLLNHAPGNEATHRMGDQVNFPGVCPGPDFHYEVIEAGRRFLDVEPVARDLVAQAAENPLSQVEVRWRLERGRGLVIEAVDPQ